MALSDNLIAYWSLEEASGTRVDATGRGNDLSPTAAPGNTTGKVGNALSLNGSTQYISRADNADLSMGDIDFTIAGWFNIPSLATWALVTKWNTTGNHREYWLGYFSSKFQFFVSSNGTATASVAPAATSSTSAWHFVVCWHDSVNNFIKISVDDGAVASSSYSSGVFDDTTEFRIGADVNGSFFGGPVDEVGIWKRVLTAAEITDLYNSGNGRDYAYISAPSGALLLQSMTGGMRDLRGGMRG